MSSASEKDKLVPGYFQLDFMTFWVVLPFGKFQDHRRDKWVRFCHSNKIPTLWGRLIFSQKLRLSDQATNQVVPLIFSKPAWDESRLIVYVIETKDQNAV